MHVSTHCGVWVLCIGSGFPFFSPLRVYDLRAMHMYMYVVCVHVHYTCLPARNALCNGDPSSSN